MSDPAAPNVTSPVVDENQIIAERRGKLAQLRADGLAYPNDFRRDALAADLHGMHDPEGNETLEPKAIRVAVAGRMMLKRVMGKACFATLQDMSGRIQLYVTLDGVGAGTLDAFKHWDLGDIVGATGTLFKTKTGELSVKCDAVRLLSKALRPLPEKFHGLAAAPPGMVCSIGVSTSRMSIESRKSRRYLMMRLRTMKTLRDFSFTMRST